MSHGRFEQSDDAHGWLETRGELVGKSDGAGPSERIRSAATLTAE